ncbi:MAG: hypothetical protein JWP38_2987 [Herbaspirillum sp.]|jgi:hypothetical protein|nr:hypothetical protein [Herbaspirillum sp.]
MSANFDVDGRISEIETDDVVAEPDCAQPGSAKLATL